MMATLEEELPQEEGWSTRKEEIRARFAEQAVNPVVDGAVGMSLVGAGVATMIVGMVRGRRGVLTWLLSSAIVLAGLAVIGGGAFARRSGRIATAEETVREHLAGLDPFARARILKEMASETAAPFIHWKMRRAG